jgi:serpin B
MDSTSRRDVLVASGALAGAVLAGCLDGASASGSGFDGDEERLETLVEANTEFAFALHRELVSGSEGANVLTSPHGVSVAMAMLYAGARGETEAAMADAMRYGLPQDELHPAIEELSATLDRRADDAGDLGLLDRLRGREAAFELSVANALWGNGDYTYRESYLDTLEEHYGAGLRGVDFADPATRAEINDWVAGETNDRIEELLPEGSIGPDTHLVVTNAIHLLADWAKQFDPEDTAEGEFTALDGSTTRVPMMRQTAEFPVAAENGVSLVELPYVGEELSMVVIVPDGERVAFESFEARLDAGRLGGLLWGLETSEAEVVLPRFEFAFDAHLNDALSALGMADAFDPDRANFEGMTDVEVAIADVFHESYIAVDEAGTEAAAATAGSMDESAPPRVVADRPFLFLIRDRSMGAILFLGRVGDMGEIA